MTDILVSAWAAIYLMLTLCFVWEILSRTLPISCPAPVRALVAEIWYAIPFLMLTDLAIRSWGDPTQDNLMDYAVKGIALACWLTLRPPDDRWKRRRKRLAAKVRRRGARLVVTAEGSR